MANWRNTREYRIWRIGVIRKGKKCECCGSIKCRHAHHIKHATYYVSIRFDVNNGMVLCCHCHSILHNKFAGGYRKKCTEKHVERMLFVRNSFMGIESN